MQEVAVETSEVVVALLEDEVLPSGVRLEAEVASVVHPEEAVALVEELLVVEAASEEAVALAEEEEVVATRLYLMLKSWSCIHEAFRNTLWAGKLGFESSLQYYDMRQAELLQYRRYSQTTGPVVARFRLLWYQTEYLQSQDPRPQHCRAATYLTCA